MPPPPLSKNVIDVLTRAGKFTDSSVSEAYSSGARVRKNRNGAAEMQHNGGALCVVRMEDKEKMPLYRSQA